MATGVGNTELVALLTFSLPPRPGEGVKTMRGSPSSLGAKLVCLELLYPLRLGGRAVFRCRFFPPLAIRVRKVKRVNTLHYQ